MRRLLRLVLLCLIALALPLQGAVAMATRADEAHAGPAMSKGPATAPCGHCPGHAAHAIDKVGCGFCCGPALAPCAVLAIAPVARIAVATTRRPASVPAPLFLTGGPERPPRSHLA